MEKIYNNIDDFIESLKMIHWILIVMLLYLLIFIKPALKYIKDLFKDLE